MYLKSAQNKLDLALVISNGGSLKWDFLTEVDLIKSSYTNFRYEFCNKCFVRGSLILIKTLKFGGKKRLSMNNLFTNIFSPCLLD